MPKGRMEKRKREAETTSDTSCRELWALGAQDDSDSNEAASHVSADLGLVREYIQEARDHLLDAELQLALLEEDLGNKASLEAVLQAVHSINSGANFLHLKDIFRCTHEAESLLDFALKGDVQVTKRVRELLFDTVDILRTLLTNVENAVSGDGLLYAWPQVRVLVEALRQVFIQQVVGETELKETVEEETVLTPRLAVERDGMIRVDSRSCDQLFQQFLELSALLPEGDEKARGLVAQMERSLQDLRLVSLGSFLPILEKTTKDTAGNTGKKVECLLLGGDWFIPRQAGEILKDALIQLARNAITHGIETPEARRSLGKDEEGTLLLTAYEDEENWCLEVADDGAGICRDTILDQARHAGILEEERHPSPEEIDHLIFAPGITTTPSACEVAGRGVGLDRVWQAIKRLKGTVEVSSVPGSLTCFRIKLPIEHALTS